MSEPQVTIVIPCYDEAETIPRLALALDAAVAALEEGGRPTEVVIVDDGSTDGSFVHLQRAAASRPWLRLLRLRRNYGQTAALAAGIERARGPYVVTMDADLQNDPADIPALLARLEEGHDVVSGWRRERKDAALTRKLPSSIANWLIGRISGLHLHDFGCTLKAYRREFLDPTRLYGEMHRFLPLYARFMGARVTEQVVRHYHRKEGRSKYGVGRTTKVLLDLITLVLLADYSTKPLYLFGRWGFRCMFAGVVCGGVVLVQKWQAISWAHRNPLLLLAVMLFLVGMQLIGMGLLAELQVRTYHESQRKPVYLVAEEVNVVPARAGHAG